MVWSRDRCCIAVPLYNAGIYGIIAQFAVISLVTGVLSFAAPYIVALSIPSFGSYVLGAVCIVIFGLQGWGFFGVFKEKPATYRKFVAVNSVAIALAFVLALVWIILSAVRHSAATTHCVDQFITNSDANTTTSTDGSLVKVSADTVNGHTLCSIFTWVQLGVMGGLWIALVILEFYFAMMSRIYGTEQRQDHKRYNSIFTEQRQSFLRNSVMWENGRQSMEDPPLPPSAHGRTFSTVSKSSGLRNEMKIANEDEDDGAADMSMQSATGERSALNGKHQHYRQASDAEKSFSSITDAAGYQSTPLYSSPVKAAYGHGYTNSRSNLAPVDSAPALQNQHQPYTHQSAYSGQYDQQHHRHQEQPRYDDPRRSAVAEDFADYYAR